jgi:uncharacterized protein
VRVFLDTNVLVSAHATRGLCADVLRLVLTEHELLTGEVVLQEVERVLADKFRVPTPVVDEVLASLRMHHVEPTPDSSEVPSVRDPDDAIVLASARAAGAEVLVTGDKDLLDIREEIEWLQIIDPRGFWTMHRTT